jgi:hypothetical protein
LASSLAEILFPQAIKAATSQKALGKPHWATLLTRHSFW